MVRPLRRGVRASCAVSLAALLALSPVGIAAADTVVTDDPAEAAAGYLVSALVDGERIQSEFDGDFFDAPGATADTVYALAAVGVASGSIEAATDWLETQATTYAGAGDDVSAGAIGKLLIAAAVTDRDPEDFGGVDLVTKVQDAEMTDADAEADDAGALLGRYRDVSEFGDFSSPLTQSLVLLGLERSGAEPSEAAVQLLLDHQCDDGGFASAFPSADDPDPACTSSVDTTGYAGQALLALDETDAAADAAAWLDDVQSPEGSFGSADGQNTNSAGLAAVVLSLVGGYDEETQAARDFIVGVQDGADSETPGAIPFNAEERGFVELATSQAIPGLIGVSLAEVTAEGASSDVPVFAGADEPDETTEDDAGETDEPDETTEDDAGETDEATEDDAGETDEATEDDADAGDAGDEMEQPTRVDSGLSPPGPTPGSILVAVAMVLGLTLLIAAVPSRRVRSRE